MLAIIGGTGLSSLSYFDAIESKSIQTPYGDAAVEFELCEFEGRPIVFLPRHGKAHAIPPHKINYRANIWALKQAGVTQVIAVNAVGGIHSELGPGDFAVPDQLIDYSYGRDATFFEDDLREVVHIDFSYPYSERLRQVILESVREANAVLGGIRACLDSGVYACTQGPRLETAAEIQRLKQDGCDMVGMTAMPEAALARELQLDYACLALSVNWGAGLTEELITLEDIHKILAEGMEFVGKVLTEVATRAENKNS